MAALGGLGRPVQIAYAVPNAVEAAQRWALDYGAGPFTVRRHIPLAHVMHRGRPSTFDHTSAYGQWGEVMVELVEDHTDGPSVVSDVFSAGHFGLHHLAFFVTDLNDATERLNALGHETAMQATTTSGISFHFVDAVATFGHMIELYERTPALSAFYAAIAGAARNWDGTTPVRFA